MKRPISSEDVHKLTHDFNNLLTAIIGASDAVLGRSGVDPETRADIAHIREGARRGTALVQSLGETARNAEAPPGSVSIHQAILATCRLLDHSLGANVTLVLDLRAPGGRVTIDPSQLDRALLNLIANARHAMPDGGTVTLGTSRRGVAIAEARVPDTIPPGDYVVIMVEDGGAGIPREQISRIFETGVSSRRRAGGSGIGLPSTRDIVRHSNGFLSVASVEGQGTRFEIHLPLVESKCLPIEPSAAKAGTVLLVEDDLFVRRVTERTLHRSGWIVLCAGSAEEALDRLRETRCDMLISDIALPGMDGVALARQALVQWPDMPVILTSGYQRSTLRAAEETASVVFLTKPYGQAELLDTIAYEILEGKTGGHSALSVICTLAELGFVPFTRHCQRGRGNLQSRGTRIASLRSPQVNFGARSIQSTGQPRCVLVRRGAWRQKAVNQRIGLRAFVELREMAGVLDDLDANGWHSGA